MRKTIRRWRPASRRGTTVLEALAALGMLLAAGGVMAGLISASAGQQRRSEQRQQARETVANGMEHAAALPWEQLATQPLNAHLQSEAFGPLAGSQEIVATVSDEAGPPAAKRIELEVRWPTTGETHHESVRLVSWRHQPAEASP